MTKPHFVLDSWAVLALLQDEEPASSVVQAHLDAAVADQATLSMSIINLGEVFYRVAKTKGVAAAQAVLAMLRSLPIGVESATDEAVMAAAQIKARLVVSYADAFAVHTAQMQGASLLTGDPELLALTPGLRIVRLERQDDPGRFGGGAP